MAHEHGSSALSGGAEVIPDAVMRSMLPGRQYWDATHPPYEDSTMQSVELFNYRDVNAVLTKEGLYSLQVIPLESSYQMEIFKGYWTQDNPQHRQLRSILTPHFRREIVENRLGTSVAQEVNRAVEGIVAAGEGAFDFTATLGKIPVNIMTNYMGMRLNDPVLKEWLDASNVREHTPEQETAALNIFKELFERRRKELPPDTVRAENPVDALIVAQRAGHIVLDEQLTDDWAIAQLTMLRGAGDHTTMASLGNILQGMSIHNILPRLATHPEHIPAATEEGQRRYPSFPRAFGRTRTEVLVGTGTDTMVLPPETTVGAWISAANFDPRVFEDPWTFNIGREINPHLTWGGAGWRSCTGRYLARTVINRVVEAAITRLPGLEWDGQDFDRVRGPMASVYAIPEGALRFTFDADKAQELAARRQSQGPR